MKNLSPIATLKVLIVAASCIGSSYVVAAKYYKWVDEQGVTHYSAQPPEAGKGEVIKVKAGASSDKDAALKRLEDRRAKLQQDVESRANPKKDSQSDIDRQNAEIVKKNCETNRKNLKTMTENTRIRQLDEKGEARVLPEEERQQNIKKAQEYIKANCS